MTDSIFMTTYAYNRLCFMATLFLLQLKNILCDNIYLISLVNCIIYIYGNLYVYIVATSLVTSNLKLHISC